MNNYFVFNGVSFDFINAPDAENAMRLSKELIAKNGVGACRPSIYCTVRQVFLYEDDDLMDESVCEEMDETFRR